MTKQQKITLSLLAGLSLVFLAIYLLPNQQGAANAEMLSIFQPDEYAQYPFVIHMLLSGATLKATFHNFIVYGHYYYGYPFYFFSALSLIPVKLLWGANWTSATRVIMMVLRTVINVLPMLLAIGLLAWMFTRFQSAWKSALLFVFLETLSAVVANNLWWHVDSLLVLYCVLTLFFLQRDDLHFGKNFYFSGIACGFAIGTKTLAALFVTTYLVYLIYGLVTHKLLLRKLVRTAGCFLIVLAGTIVITNPQILMPEERKEIIAVMQSNYSKSAQGFWVAGGGIAQNWGTLKGYIRDSYSGAWIFIPSLLFLILGIVNKKTRLTSLLFFSWMVTYCFYFIFIAATLRPHYFLPPFLPLFACLALFWSDQDGFSRQKIGSFQLARTNHTFWLNLLSVLLLSVMTVLNTVSLIEYLPAVSREEANSPSIQFFKQVDQDYLIKLPTDKNFTLYRDWYAYVAPRSNWNVVMSWDLTNYSKIGELKPVILFLEADNISYFSNSSTLANGLDQYNMKMKYDLYSDAKNNSIRGYVLLESSKFGKAFARQDVYDTYLRP
jgi:hypothetical protein